MREKGEPDMTITDESERTDIELIDELNTWLEENWDPDLTVGEWWERLGMAGWAAPMLPKDCYGRGLSRAAAMRVSQTIAKFGALGAPVGMGVGLVSPTIATHGTREQIDRYIPDAITGKKGWCQLFSEPGAGSDLAGLSTKATRYDDVWTINGQKVWTSGGQNADLGMLLARTDPDAPKHQGITWFAFEMRQPGVDIRPLREMTGNAMFCEVFFSDAQVSDDARIGDLNDGWKVANTTLMHERSGMGAGARRGLPSARAGTIAGDLGKRAGDFVQRRPKTSKPSQATGKRPSPAQTYIDLAKTFGKDQDPVVRQRLAQLHIMHEVARLSTERQKAARASGGDIPGLPNLGKLLMGHTVRYTRDLGMHILGPRGLLHPSDAASREILAGEPGGAPAIAVTAQALGAQALPIFGGTDQIQMNIIGERVLGLPKEPGDMSTVPFSELRRNA
jgi:alkylation response protein AidB-like acyl-CoA dehydrogenase